jgi:hypothetical protein
MLPATGVITMRVRRNLSAVGAAVSLLGGVAVACTSSSNPGVPTDDGGGGDDVTDASGGADAVYERSPYDSTMPQGVPRVPVVSEMVNDRIDVQSLMFASGEMQTSGEPFASNFAGRNLSDYDRNYIPPDQYILNNGGDDPMPITDLFGFSTAVESYEYSKYHMNMVVHQTSAGISLANGPVVATEPGATSLDRLVARSYDLMTNAGTDVGGYATLPAPVGNNQNYLGFPGLWPVMTAYKDFDPTLAPTPQVVQSCTYKGGYGGVGFGSSVLPLYECAYNTLHLPNRDTQVDKTLVPAVSGYTAWKQALWAIDFAGRIHDSGSNQVTTVRPQDIPMIGQRGNTVVATDSPGTCGAGCPAVGTYIGSSPLEGMWGLMMLASIDNDAEFYVRSLATSDGLTLTGFPSKLAALQYDYGSALAWWPAAMSVTEDQTVPYPAVTSMAIVDATSRAVDLAALLQGNSLFFGTTDPRNAGVGQRVGFQATYDGDPFPADDGIADGEDTAHDRSLAVLRVAFLDIDQIHADPALGVIVDTATVSGPSVANVTRSPTITTSTLAHVVIALRQTLLSINGSISQYGAPDPSPEADLGGILNALPFHPPASAALDGGAAPNFSQRVRQVFTTQAAFFRDVLTKSDGTVANGATLANGKATLDPSTATLLSQAAAIRALNEGFLVTGDETYRTRARAVVTHLDGGFYSQPARMYRGQDGGPDQVHMNAELFGWLQSALRETYKSLFVPSDPVLDRTVLEDRITRVNKLFLNGWDDLNGNQSVDKPQECLTARLQMAEQALTGELGRDGIGRPTDDRDGDCVRELSHAQVASAIPSDVYFHSP